MADRRRRESAGSGSVTPTPSSPSDSRYGQREWTGRPSVGGRMDSTASTFSTAGGRSARRGSVASITSSIGGVLDIAGQMDGARAGSATRDISQNAISTLLQPPIVRTGLLPYTALPTTAGHRPPSVRDIPPVTLTTIPHVEPSAFDTYLSQVGPLYEAISQAEAEEQNPAWLRRDRAGSKDSDVSSSVRTRGEPPYRPRHGSRQSSISSILSPIESPQAPRRRSSGGIIKSRLTVAPLSSIPTVYFDENFHLENPRTFDVVSEKSEIIQSPQPQINEDAGRLGNGNIPTISAPPKKALATNAILQEKLSFYLDTVEIHLIASISTASKSFFAALGSLKGLHSEAAESVTKIQKLREDLRTLDEQMALGGLDIVAMKRRRENLGRLYSAVQQLKFVVNGASMCGDLVEHGDLDNALYRIGMLEDFACGRPDPRADLEWLCPERIDQLIDLRRLRCLDGFAEGMDQLRARIGRGYEQRFISVLLTDLREHIASVPNRDTLLRWAQASQRSRGGLQVPGAPKSLPHLETSKKLRQELSDILDGLGRSRSTAVAAKSFWDEIMKETKSLIRQSLPSSTDDDAESTMSASTNRSRTSSRAEKSQILARNLHALEPEDAEEMFVKVYCSISEAVRRLQTQVKLLLDVTSGNALLSPPSSPPKSPRMLSIDDQVAPPPPPPKPDMDVQTQLMQALDMSNLLGQAVETAQIQITRVVRVRTPETTRLPLQQFLHYFTLHKLFADECEAITGRSGADLRGVVDEQIKGFIANFGERERQDLADTMEKDRWDALDFTEQDAAVLNQVVQAMQSDPEIWLKQAHIWDHLPSSSNNSLVNGTSVPLLTNGTVTNGTTTQSTPSQPLPSTKATATRPATLDEETYLLTKSALHLLHGLGRFMTLLANLPRLAPDLSASMTDYIRLFTSRTNQLVLFAGATKSAGLERINTKHLALASRVLGFASALLPYVREFVRRKATSAGLPGVGSAPGTASVQSLMASFDSVRKGTVNNQLSVHEKLVSIMSARCRTHVASLKKIDFDKEGAALNLSAVDFSSTTPTSAPTGKSSAYIDTLTKETITLHRVLSKHLPSSTVQQIMREVFDNYKETLGEGIKELELRTEAGRSRLINDILTFSAKLTPLDKDEDGNMPKYGAAAEATGFLFGLVRAKTLVGGGPAAATSTEARTSNEQKAASSEVPVGQNGDSATNIAADKNAGSNDDQKVESVVADIPKPA